MHVEPGLSCSEVDEVAPTAYLHERGSLIHPPVVCARVCVCVFMCMYHILPSILCVHFETRRIAWVIGKWNALHSFFY